jgi:hypothetical protein
MVQSGLDGRFQGPLWIKQLTRTNLAGSDFSLHHLRGLIIDQSAFFRYVHCDFAPDFALDQARGRPECPRMAIDVDKCT